RMITLKVLNSIVLLGTSCMFVKEANMEEKLSDPPPSVASSRANSRANRGKNAHTAPQQGYTAALCYIQKQINFYLLVKMCMNALK
ncbi:Transmembrane anterior posterior transformation protein 1, partial [Xenoophorus captivus]